MKAELNDQLSDRSQTCRQESSELTRANRKLFRYITKYQNCEKKKTEEKKQKISILIIKKSHTWVRNCKDYHINRLFLKILWIENGRGWAWAWAYLIPVRSNFHFFCIFVFNFLDPVISNCEKTGAGSEPFLSKLKSKLGLKVCCKLCRDYF